MPRSVGRLVCHLLVRPAVDEHRLPPPLDPDGLAHAHVPDVELGRDKGTDVGRNGHGGDELDDEGTGRGDVGEAGPGEGGVGVGAALPDGTIEMGIADGGHGALAR